MLEYRVGKYAIIASEMRVVLIEISIPGEVHIEDAKISRISISVLQIMNLYNILNSDYS
jgi:hypothetical protein